jgi:outer membrane lipoprotein SlyB
MKKSFLIVAILASFTLFAVAQDASQAGGAQGSTTDSATKKMSHDKMSSGKGSTLTGCVSASPNADGMYTLSNAKMKNGVEIGPADKVKDHAGHQVSLTGKWSTAAAAGEAAAAGKEKGEKHFEVDDVKHISPTCSEAPGGGTTGAKMKSKKEDKKTTSSATPPQI